MFDKQLFLVKYFDGFTPLKALKFDKETFWIQFHHLSLGGINKYIGKSIGSIIQMKEMVDVDKMALVGESMCMLEC